MTEVITWEADELRAGMRKIPGYAGHLTGVRHTLGMTYGNASAEALGEDKKVLQFYQSAILGHRKDGYTTPAHPDFPFKDEIYRKRPNDYYAKVIPQYAGHRPGWTHTHAQTMGKYAAEKMLDFTQTTRKKSKTLRVRTQPADIFALRDPEKPPPTVPLYESGPGYIPHTTLYAPAARERFGAGFSTLTRQAFKLPTPKIPAPLESTADGKSLDFLALPSSYMGYKPRALPWLCRRLDEQKKAAEDRMRQEAAIRAQERKEWEERAQRQERKAAAEEEASADDQDHIARRSPPADDGEVEFPEQMYELLDVAQGNAAFTQEVQAAAAAYARDMQSHGESAALENWEANRAYLETTYMKQGS